MTKDSNITGALGRTRCFMLIEPISTKEGREEGNTNLSCFSFPEFHISNTILENPRQFDVMFLFNLGTKE